MSEDLATSSTKSQASTQKECMSSPDLNFSLHIHITATPALQVALEKIVEALKLGEPVFHGLNVEQTSELIEKGVVNFAMTGPDSSQKENIQADKTPVKHVPKKGPKVHWMDIPKHPQLRYREDGVYLVLNYSGSILTTTWEAVERAARLDPKLWKYEIEKIVGNRPTTNRKAAASLFLKLVEKGEVSRVTISQFQSDESTGVSV